jgi:hypothetical protein
MQHCVIKLVSDSVVFSGYSVSSINTTDRHEIAELLLNVVLSTITQLQPTYPETTNGASCLKFIITWIKISNFSKLSCSLNRFDCIILSCILFCKRQQNEFRYKNTNRNRTHFRLPGIVSL